MTFRSPIGYRIEKEPFRLVFTHDSEDILSLSTPYIANFYLQHGTWQDYWNGKLYNGPSVLEKYSAQLDTLPIFTGKIEYL
jgi:hypothetical protein